MNTIVRRIGRTDLGRSRLGLGQGGRSVVRFHASLGCGEGRPACHWDRSPQQSSCSLRPKGGHCRESLGTDARGQWPVCLVVSMAGDDAKLKHLISASADQAVGRLW